MFPLCVELFCQWRRAAAEDTITKVKLLKITIRAGDVLIRTERWERRGSEDGAVRNSTRDFCSWWWEERSWGHSDLRWFILWGAGTWSRPWCCGCVPFRLRPLPPGLSEWRITPDLNLTIRPSVKKLCRTLNGPSSQNRSVDSDVDTFFFVFHWFCK